MIKYVCDKCGMESLDDDNITNAYIPLLGNYHLCEKCREETQEAYRAMSEKIDKELITLVRSEAMNLYKSFEMALARDLAKGYALNLSDSEIRGYINDVTVEDRDRT